VGIAIIDPVNERFYGVNADSNFALMSVVKFPQAYCVIHLADQGIVSLNSKIRVTKEDMGINTWSPFAKDKKAMTSEIDIRGALKYSAGLSDNILFDKLFDIAPAPTLDSFIKQLGIGDLVIKSSYKNLDIHDYNVNHGTPRAVAEVFNAFRQKKMISDSNFNLLKMICSETNSGGMRLKAGLPEGTMLVHKTGTNDHSFGDTLITAVNDAAWITSAGGKVYLIAVLINHSKVSYEETEAMIAEISRITYSYLGD